MSSDTVREHGWTAGALLAIHAQHLAGCGRDVSAILKFPSSEVLHGHPLHGRGLAGYQAHEVVNPAWIEEAVKVNPAHPHHSDAPFRQLHHHALLFHDEILEALARGIESRVAEGTTRAILADLTGSLTDQPHRPGP